MKEKIAIPYTDAYIEKLFDYWYAHGAPSPKYFYAVVEKTAELHDEHGRCPSAATLNAWIIEKNFRARKDLLDARVATQIDDELVAMKVNMLKEQAADFRAVRQKAAKHLLDEEFDSSSAAVNAFIRAAQEERIAVGLSKTIQKMAELDDDGLLRQVKELAAQVSGEIIDVADLPDSAEEEEEDT